jgi:hypothetical protein
MAMQRTHLSAGRGSSAFGNGRRPTMKLNYVPLLPLQRQLQGLPRDYARFQEYLRTVMNSEGTGPELVPLLLANPMARDHVTALLDALLALDADGVAARAASEVSAQLDSVPGDYDVGLVVVDDLMGGWTNRYAAEYTIRFQIGPPPEPRPRWMTTRPWVYGVLWSSEPASEKSAREAILTAIHRMAYVQQHGLAQSVRARLAQEGQVMAAAGCTAPILDPDDIAYTREVLLPLLDAEDMRTTIECVFGDAGRTLGFSPHGLSPWAGLALALHDATPNRSQHLTRPA